MAEDIPIVVVFGIPGAGKSTIASSAIEKLLGTSNHEIKGLDLDFCITDSMKQNFARGIYPTMEERNKFSLSCCDYVKQQLSSGSNTPQAAALISFSFVNTDLRDIFRSNFPNCVWVLVDTTEQEAKRRINERKGHFYKGDTGCKKAESTSPDTKKIDSDNTDWKFAPVTFDHIVLDGHSPIDENSEKLVNIVLTNIKK